MVAPVLVAYEFIGPADAPETGFSSSFELFASDSPTDVLTVLALREAFPYVGNFHFRAKIPFQETQYAWLDLTEEDTPLPLLTEESDQPVVAIRVLPLAFEDEDEDRQGKNGGELDFSGPDLDQYIVESCVVGEGGGSRGGGGDALGVGGGRDASFSSPGGSYGNWAHQLKGVGESVITSDVARDLTKKGLKVGKQVGKQVNKLWRLVGEGLGGGERGEGGAGDRREGGSMVPEGPSPSSVRYLRRWEDALVTPPDAETLLALWKALFPGAASRDEGAQARSRQWRRAGCEEEDPLREFRGTGSMCVRCLTYFARTYPEKTQDILERYEAGKKGGGGNQEMYPLIGVSNSLVLIMVDIFKLRDARYVHVQSTMWNLFQGGGYGTMEEVFSAALAYLDRRWMETEASIEGFSTLARETRRALEGVLGQGPLNLPHFQALAQDAGLGWR